MSFQHWIINVFGMNSICNSLAILYIPMTKYAFEFSRQFTGCGFKCLLSHISPFFEPAKIWTHDPRVWNGCKFKCGPWLEIEIRMSYIQLGYIFSQILHTLPILCIPKCRVLKVVTVFRPQKLAKQKASARRYKTVFW